MTSDLPDRIGPYRILEMLGEGGMGAVYLAEQTAPVRRKVALKIIKHGAASEQVIARFDTERKALAVMDHPCIAKIYDAGVTEDGRPFFAMERVTGVPLSRYCDDHKLTVRQRVELFIQLCHAVQHAHQKGVIHRDLKPSNVLVTEVDGRPLPRVIDFGIAKAIEGGDFDDTRLTRDDQVIGTPAYISPEQIGGSGDVDTRADIFALGVMLYEILVGALPYEDKTYRGWAALAATLHREPPPPAKRFAQRADTQEEVAAHRSTTPGALARALAGDLGWIAFRAMEKNREQRYETANGMALDLQRYLAHEPVRARGAGTAYVVRKFVRRNRLGVAFAATVTAGIVGFAITTRIQADRIARARDEAEARRGQAEELIDFMLVDLRTKLEPLGRLDVLEDVGDQAVAYFASLPEEQFSESELLSRSQALYQIGSVRLAEGLLPAADTAFSESLRLARELSRRDDANDDWLFGLGQAEFWAGELARRRGDLGAANRQFQTYRDISAELVARDPANLTYLKEQGYGHTNLGAVRRAEGRPEEALEEFQAALAVKEQVVEAEPSLAHRYDLSRSYNTVGIILSDLGRLRDAADYLTRDIAVKEAILAEAPDNATFQDRLSISLQFLGDVLWTGGDVPGALARFQRAESILEPMVRRDPGNAVRHRALVIARGWVGSLLAVTGRELEALRILDDALATMRALAEANPEQTAWAGNVATHLRRQGEVLLRLGRLEAAEAAAREAIGVLEGLERTEGLSGAAQRELVWSLVLQGEVWSGLGRSQEARGPWARALALADASAASTGHRLDREAKAAALLRLGRHDEARPVLEALVAGGFGRPALLDMARSAGIHTP